MAKRGPKPQPTNLRLLQGGRVRNVAEPKPQAPPEIPDPPGFLNAYAKAEWFRIIEDLYSTGVYASIDESMLAAYCSAYARWRAAEEDLEKMAEADPTTHAALIKTTNGNAIQNPLVGVASSARRDMARLAAEFGLTPSSRTMINASQGEEPNARGRRYFAD